KKTSTIKVLKAITPFINLEDNIVLDAITSNTGPTNLPPANYNAPIIISTLKKVRKYLTKENFNKKSTTIVYFHPPDSFI
ncbi:hypothetical protein NEUTE1DRAFT_55097, partial [Neurospora tetrasperma FGSC 2508]